MFPGSIAYLILIIIGIISCIFYVYMKSHNLLDTLQRKVSFYSAFFFSLLVFYLSALLFDAIFHSINEGYFEAHGITFLGGLIGGILFFIIFYFLFKVDKKKKLMNYLNVIAPGICIAHVFGRIGCFLGGCCFGKPTESFIGVIYPLDAPAYEIYAYSTPLIPVQLFEALGLLILFIFLIKFNKNQFFIYLISYSIMRFFLEFLRGDDRGRLFGILSPAQEISIIILIISISLLIYQKRNRIIKE